MLKTYPKLCRKLKNGSISILDASRQYDIPPTTLGQHVKNRSRDSSKVSVITKKVGRKLVFNEEQEPQLES